MRIAVPVQDGLLNPHFGQSEAFELFDVDEGSGKLTSSGPLALPGEGGCSVIPGWLAGQGVQVVICGGLGGGALARLQQAGIRVVHGAPVETPAALVHALLQDSLATTGGLCDHHHHDGDGHQHHHHHHHHHHGHGHGHDHGRGSSCCGSDTEARAAP